jgi:hypothetical protein
MRACKIDVTKLMIVLIDNENFVRRLNKEVGLNIRPHEEGGTADWPAVDPKGWGFARQHELVAFLQFIARPGLKDGAAQISEWHCRLAASPAELVIADIGVRRILPDWASP